MSESVDYVVEHLTPNQEDAVLHEVADQLTLHQPEDYLELMSLSIRDLLDGYFGEVVEALRRLKIIPRYY